MKIPKKPKAKPAKPPVISNAKRPQVRRKVVNSLPAPYTHLDAVAIKIICKHVRKGIFLDTVAAYLGIAPRTIRHWLRRGRIAFVNKDESPDEAIYRDLYWKYRQALSQADMRDLKVVDASPDWKARKWKLEFRNKRYRLPSEKQHTHTHEHQGNITHAHTHVEIDCSKLPLELAEKLLEYIDTKQEEKVQELLASHTTNDGETPVYGLKEQPNEQEVRNGRSDPNPSVPG